MNDIVTEATIILGPKPAYYIAAVDGPGKLFALSMERPALPCQHPPQAVQLFSVFVDDTNDPAPEAVHHLHTFFCN